MLAAALVYSFVLLGPWGQLKLAAYQIGSPAWFAYAAGFVMLALVLIPGAYLASAWLGRRMAKVGTRGMRGHYLCSVAGLVPLGLAAWAAFSLSFALINISYLWPTLSDPLGWGWDLFGTAAVAWGPLISGWVPTLQAIVLVVGLAWASATTLRAVRTPGSSRRGSLAAALPTLLLNLGMTALLMVLYL
jgi:hypothetical protein